jgi:hypothetical protein
MKQGSFYYKGYVVPLGDNKISIGIFFFVLAAAFLIVALRGNHPEQYFICPNCRTPLRKTDLKRDNCPECGGPVEDLKAYYGKHSEVQLLDKKSKI